VSRRVVEGTVCRVSQEKSPYGVSWLGNLCAALNLCRVSLYTDKAYPVTCSRLVEAVRINHPTFGPALLVASST
jgi:hypothetical protein